MSAKQYDKYMGNDISVEEKHTLKIKGVWMPAMIFFDEDLLASEKDLFAIIFLLDGKDGCFATNGYLSSILRYSTKTISTGISKLIEKGFIKRTEVQPKQFRNPIRSLRITELAHKHRSPRKPPPTRTGNQKHRSPLHTDKQEIDKQEKEEKLSVLSTNSKKPNLQKKDFQDKPLDTTDQAKPELSKKQSIGSPSHSAKPKRKVNPVESQNTSQAKILRNKSKTVHRVPPKIKPKIEYKILKANQLFWDIATEYGIKLPKRPSAKNYKAMDLVFTELQEGTFFKYTPGCEHLVDRKITPTDFDRFCLHFTLAVSSPEYMPKSLSIKQSWKNWYLTDILYKNGSRNPNGNSLFAIYLDNPPEKVGSDIKQIKDPDPEGTDVVITQCLNRLGMDLSNGGRSSAIKCVQKLTNYFEENKDNLIGYETYYSMLHQQIQELLDMLEYNSSPEYPVKPNYLYGELTYNKKMTEYFKYINVWRS